MMDEPKWVQVDAWGRKLAGKRSEADAETGEWLLAVRDEQVHRQLGMGSMFEYVERVLGLEPHAAAERLRVADALKLLPAIREALARGDRAWSVVRELTRVAVPETEREWLDSSEGKRVREVEQMVAGRRPGQRPCEPGDPRLVRRVLRFEVTGEAWALFHEAARVLRRQVDPRMSDEQILSEMARRALVGPADEGRAPYQVALSVCEDCGRAFQDARGEKVEVTPEVLERATCDAQHLGRIDPDSSPVGLGAEAHSPSGPTAQVQSPVGRAPKTKRASQTIPPAVRRLVMRRDGGRCRVDGCASTGWVELHHLKLRSEGGDHEPSRIFLACSTHHDLIHQGLLLVEGESLADLRFRHADGTDYGKKPDIGLVAIHGAAYSALRNMGFRETETKRALAEVRSRVGRSATLEEVVRLALRILTDGPAAVDRAA